MVIHREMLLVEERGGREGRATPENLQNVHLYVPCLHVVLTQFPDVSQNKGITSSSVGLFFLSYPQ